MTFILATFLAIVQGLTEFLPVSSSGHLAVLSHFAGMKEMPVFFATVLHLGTLVAVCVAFKDDIRDILRGLLKKKKEAFIYTFYIILTTFITGIIGLLAKKGFESTYNNILLIAFFWIITGLFLIFSDKIKEKNHKLNIKIAILIGLAQAFAIFPGISRSGATLIAALLLGLSRKEAVRYAFLISIPAILGAAVVEGKDAVFTTNIPLLYFIFGFLVSAVVGYFSIILLIKLVKNGKLRYFSYYLFLVAFSVILYYII